ncbi:copper transporter [Ornithinimicrobium sufpigmenti]|uniref:copper transporter n=1 Tax=Ornithinimicrobium sufpigmenti TaxID=2508882 RepID=UPI0010359DF9|nr:MULTISPECIES: copper transporter [unclassified Ornithinimicrobium]
MIDFRYHLVSLVAVFIALAVGIVLGAGPLREGISDTLEGEVSDLRAERAEVRAQAAEAVARADALDEAMGVIAPRTASATLTGVRVAVVVLPGADRNLGEQLTQAVDEAGGSVPLTVTLQPSWQTEQGQEEAVPLLDELAGDLQLPTLPEGEGPSLPAVVGAALVGADGPGRTGAWLEALDQLNSEGYLRLAWSEETDATLEDRRPPDAVLVVAGGLSLPEEGDLDEAGTLALDTRTGLVRTIVRLDTPLTVSGTGTVGGTAQPEGGADPLVVGIRQDRALRAQTSTVDDAEGAAGRLSTILALGWEVAGRSGHYGIGPQSEAPMPQPPPVRLVTGLVPDDQEQATEPVPDDPEDPSGPGQTGDTGVTSGAGDGDPRETGDTGAGDDAADGDAVPPVEDDAATTAP